MVRTPDNRDRAFVPIEEIRKKDIKHKPALMVGSIVVDDLVWLGIEVAKNPVATARVVWRAVGGKY